MSGKVQKMSKPDPAVATADSRKLPPAEPPWRAAPRRILVVLPAFNEEADVGPLLERIDNDMHEDGTPYQVILVDDGSTDATPQVVERHAQHMPIRMQRHTQNLGLGATIRDGLQLAVSVCSESDIIVVMDADNTHTPGLIRGMIRLVKEGSDVVIASRYQPGSLVKGVPFHRRLLSSVASILFRLAFPISGVKDFTCGYRAYRSGVLKAAIERYGDDLVSEDGFQCMVDLLLKLRKMNLIFREVPLILRYDVKEGASKMKIMRTIFRTIGLMFRRWFRR